MSRPSPKAPDAKPEPSAAKPRPAPPVRYSDWAAI